MKFIRNLETNLLVAVITFVVAVIGFAASSFLLTTSYLDIPLGFLLSGGVIGSLYIITHFFTKIDNRDSRATWSIIAITIRLVVIVGMMILIALMYYRWNMKYFNIFVFVAMYTISAAVFVFAHLSRNRKE